MALAVTAFAVTALLSGCRPPSTRDENGAPVGARVYALYCAGCHGPDGRRGEPRRHLDRAVQQSPSALRAVIENGRGPMPAWRNRLEPDEIDAVVGYIRRLGEAPDRR